MKTDSNSSNSSWSDVTIVATIILAAAALFAPLIAWQFQMSEQELQNMNTKARCKSLGGVVGQTKCFKDGKEV